MAWLTPNNSAPTDQFCRRIFIPADVQYLEAVTGALIELTYVWNWQKFGAMTPEYMAGVMGDMFNKWLDGEEVCLIGTVFAYVSADAPSGSLPCDGTVYDRVDYPTLYAALDSAFIVDADHFQVPDLRGRTVIGAGTGTGLSARTVGEVGGEESHVLITDELPAHTHTNTPHAHGYTGVTANIDIEAPGVPDLFAAGILPFQTTTAESVTIDNTGADEPHNTMQPFAALNYAVWAR